MPVVHASQMLGRSRQLAGAPTHASPTSLPPEPSQRRLLAVQPQARAASALCTAHALSPIQSLRAHLPRQTRQDVQARHVASALAETYVREAWHHLAAP